MTKIIINAIMLSSLLCMSMNSNASDANNVDAYEEDEELVIIENVHKDNEELANGENALLANPNVFLEHIINMIQHHEGFCFLDDLKRQDAIDDIDHVICRICENTYLKTNEVFVLTEICNKVMKWLNEYNHYIVLEALIEDFNFQNKPVIMDFIKKYVSIICEKKGYVIHERPVFVTLVRRLEEHLFLDSIHGDFTINMAMGHFVEQGILTEEEMHIVGNEFQNIIFQLQQLPINTIITSFSYEIKFFIKCIVLLLWEEMGNQVVFINNEEGLPQIFLVLHQDENEEYNIVEKGG